MSESRQYIDYLKIKDDPKKEYSMISELIDNSLSSYLEHSSDYNEDLIVEIIYKLDKSNEIKVNERIDSTSALVYPNSYLQVSDNSYGIEKEKLEKALALHSVSEEQTGEFSVHGIGMKHCAFYFGATLELETIGTNSKKKLYIQKEVLNKNPLDEVPDDIANEVLSFKYHNATIGGTYKRGTTIRISNLYKEKKKNMTAIEFINVIDAISHKYIRYINKGLLKIRFKYIDDKIDPLKTAFNNKKNNISGTFEYEYIEENKFYTITQVSDKADYVFHKDSQSHLFSNFSKDKKAFDDLLNEVEDVINEKNFIKNIIAEENIDKLTINKDFSLGVFKKFKTLFIDAYKKINSKNAEEIEYKLKISIPQDDKIENNVDVTFWRLKNRHSSFRGFRVYEKDRAIYHPPHSQDDSGSRTWINDSIMHNKSSPDQRGVDYNWAGSFELDKIKYINVNDKTKIRFIDGTNIEKFQNHLMIVYQIYKLFEIGGRAKDNTTIDQLITGPKRKIILNQIPKMFQGTIGPNDINVGKNKLDNKFDIVVNDFYGSKWHFFVEFIVRPNPSYVWQDVNISFTEDDDNNDDYNKIVLKVFSAHPIWDNVDKNNNWVEELLVPYSIIKIFTEARISILKREGNAPEIDKYNSIFNEMANKKER